MLAAPYRAERLALIRGITIVKIARDAAVHVEPTIDLARRKRAGNGGRGEENIAQDVRITRRDRLAGGGHRIEGAAGAEIDVGGLNEEHALSVGAGPHDPFGEIKIHLRTQVAHQAGHVGKAGIFGQKEKQATRHHPVRLGIAHQTVDRLQSLRSSEKSERGDQRTGANPGNAVELRHGILSLDRGPAREKARAKGRVVAATGKQEKIERGIRVELLPRIERLDLTGDVRTIGCRFALCARGKSGRQFSFRFGLALRQPSAGAELANAEVGNDQQEDDG